MLTSHPNENVDSLITTILRFCTVYRFPKKANEGYHITLLDIGHNDNMDKLCNDKATAKKINEETQKLINKFKLDSLLLLPSKVSAFGEHKNLLVIELTDSENQLVKLNIAMKEMLLKNFNIEIPANTPFEYIPHITIGISSTLTPSQLKLMTKKLREDIHALSIKKCELSQKIGWNFTKDNTILHTVEFANKPVAEESKPSNESPLNSMTSSSLWKSEAETVEYKLSPLHFLPFNYIINDMEEINKYLKYNVYNKTLSTELTKRRLASVNMSLDAILSFFIPINTISSYFDHREKEAFILYSRTELLKIEYDYYQLKLRDISRCSNDLSESSEKIYELTNKLIYNYNVLENVPKKTIDSIKSHFDLIKILLCSINTDLTEQYYNQHRSRYDSVNRDPDSDDDQSQSSSSRPSYGWSPYSS